MSRVYRVCRVQPTPRPIYEPLDQFADEEDAWADALLRQEDARRVASASGAPVSSAPLSFDRYTVVPLEAAAAPRRFLTRWNLGPFEGTRRGLPRRLDGLYDTGLFWERPGESSARRRPRVRVGDHLYVVYNRPGLVHLICRFEVRSVDPDPDWVYADDGSEYLTYFADGTSTPMDFTRVVSESHFTRRILCWRKTVYQEDRHDGWEARRDGALRHHGVEDRRFLRPLAVERGANGSEFLGQTLRHLSEIGVGHEWLDARLGLPGQRSHFVVPFRHEPRGGPADQTARADEARARETEDAVLDLLGETPQLTSAIHAALGFGTLMQVLAALKRLQERGLVTQGRGGWTGRQPRRSSEPRRPSPDDETTAELYESLVQLIDTEGFTFAEIWQATNRQLSAERLGDVISRLRRDGRITKSGARWRRVA